jgi:hypothetical protein
MEIAEEEICENHVGGLHKHENTVFHHDLHCPE